MILRLSNIYPPTTTLLWYNLTAMVFTTTGLAHSLTSLGLIFCAFWFFKAFQKIGGLRSGRPIGILLSVFALGIAFVQLLFALGSLFFVIIPDAFYALLVVGTLALSITAALSVYLAFYILLPKFSPWPATTFALIYGLVVAALILITHPQPFMTGRSIDFGIPSLVEQLYFYLWVFTLGPPFLIFTKNFFSAVSKDVKIISFIIMTATFIGFINVIIEFSGFFKITDYIKRTAYDITLGIIGIVLIVGFLVLPVAWWIKSKKFSDSASKN